METYLLDARRMEPEELHRYLAEKLPLPDYYGGNLDALYDCLTELSDTRIVVTCTAAAGPAFPSVAQVLTDAAEDNPALTIALIDGEPTADLA